MEAVFDRVKTYSPPEFSRALLSITRVTRISPIFQSIAMKCIVEKGMQTLSPCPDNFKMHRIYQLLAALTMLS